MATWYTCRAARPAMPRSHWGWRVNASHLPDDQNRPLVFDHLNRLMGPAASTHVGAISSTTATTVLKSLPTARSMMSEFLAMTSVPVSEPGSLKVSHLQMPGSARSEEHT